MSGTPAEKSAFYTGRGDDGRTGLLGPERVPKHDARPEAYGTVDEAQAAIGLARALGVAPVTGRLLLAVERDLYELMAELAAAGDSNSPFAGQVTVSDVTQLEDWLAEFEGQVEMPSDFVIPGDSPAGAGLHLARTIVRRAERLAVRLADDGLLGNEQVLRYLNRLSSLLYVLALFEDSIARDGHLTLAKEG